MNHRSKKGKKHKEASSDLSTESSEKKEDEEQNPLVRPKAIEGYVVQARICK